MSNKVLKDQKKENGNGCWFVKSSEQKSKRVSERVKYFHAEFSWSILSAEFSWYSQYIRFVYGRYSGEYTATQNDIFAISLGQNCYENIIIKYHSNVITCQYFHNPIIIIIFNKKHYGNIYIETFS